MKDIDYSDAIDDDATAFRLAVKLRLNLRVSNLIAFAGKEQVGKTTRFIDDPCKAMRHSIYRAAIELSK